MKNILVTGSEGFIGKNLCAALEHDDDILVRTFTRKNAINELDELLSTADFVFHLAGVNRPVNEANFDRDNRNLTEIIVKKLTKLNKTTPILITSSTQAEQDNPYGLSKRGAEDALLTYASQGGNIFIYRLPGVFGKWSRPDYNSVVATFCHNIAHDKDIYISDPTHVVLLVYIDDVIDDFRRAMSGKKKKSKDGYYFVHPQFKVSLGDLAKKLLDFKNMRENLLVPNFEQEFDRNLYAMFTSYFDHEDIGYPLDKKSDNRGWLAEFIKSEQFGQIYISSTKPGFTRGVHWHNTKVEKFLVIEGEAEIKLRQLQSRHIDTYRVSGKELRVMEMPVGYVHSIKNIGKEDMFLLIWSQQVFNPNEPDTNFQEV